MKILPPKELAVNCMLIAMAAVVLPSCHFQKGYRKMNEGQHQKAQFHYAKAQQHPTYGPGAIFYQEKYNASRHKQPEHWASIHSKMCGLEAQLQQLSLRKIRKLHKYEVTPGNIQQFQLELEDKILRYMKAQGTIAQMETVLADTLCEWTRTTGLDSMRKIVVNKTINPGEPVLEDPAAVNTQPRKSEMLPPPDAVMADSTLHCASLKRRENTSMTYYDMQAIADGYWEDITPPNYPAFARSLKKVWDIFLVYRPFCDMGAFQSDFPDALAAQDCAFERAKDTLCLGELRPLLAFHRNNPHTYLDNDIVNQIICLVNYHEPTIELNAEEQQQLADIRLMVELQQHLSYCEPHLAEEEIIPKLRYLAKRYTHHRTVFELARRALEYFVRRDELPRTLSALDELQPLFPDERVCDPPFFHQVYKQQWFDNYRKLLIRAIENDRPCRPVGAWNTEDMDEHSLVSWGTGQEVFFARTSADKDSTWIMTSRRKPNNQWSAPKAVPELSAYHPIAPLSISNDGRFMLLKQGRRLLQSQRRGTNRPWSKPAAMRLPFNSSGRAWLSPNDSLFLLEQYSANFRFDIGLLTDVHRSRLQPNGRYGEAQALHGRINTDDFSERNTIMGAGGRMLFLVSDRLGSVGESDAYSISLDKPMDFTAVGEAVNLGPKVNSIFEDQGLSYFSEYTGFGYFDRVNRCTGSREIWEAKLERELFPKNLMRFAGIVLDENGEPAPPAGGFVEFTFNYVESNEAVTLSDQGAYFYTIPKSTKVVRLFPEVAGYYSERDTVHFLADIERGTIVRDTFYVTSFEHIREHFKLENSTFVYGTAQFKNPKGAYPELSRLAKIATRMGAEIELRGHTDESGNAASNKALSRQRAASVKAFLVDKCGFNPAKIHTYGYGAERPLCEEDTEACRRRNRRIEVVFKMPALPDSSAQN